MHTYILQRQNQQANSRHIKITYLLTAPEPAQGSLVIKTDRLRQFGHTACTDNTDWIKHWTILELVSWSLKGHSGAD